MSNRAWSVFTNSRFHDSPVTVIFSSSDGRKGRQLSPAFKRPDHYAGSCCAFSSRRMLDILFLFCRMLDICYNRLRHIEGLEHQAKLRKLYLVQNRLSVIENVGHLSQLRLLELGSNRIRVIPLSPFPLPLSPSLSTPLLSIYVTNRWRRTPTDYAKISYF